MTIAQIQGLKAFAHTHLVDTVNWARDVRDDIDENGKSKTTGDQAFIVIKTPFNRYKMSICSSYIEPPPGAPFACRSLGTVTFHDLADGKHILGPKSDATYTDIAKHINAREMTDALAAARREIAETPAEQAPGIRAKYADLVKRAERYGVKAQMPEGTPAPVAASPHESQVAPPLAVMPAVTGGAPWLGAPIIFVTNPGEQISGMQEIVGHIVKIQSHDRVSIFITPDNTEPRYCDGLPRRGTPAGNGRVHQFNCWDFNPHWAALMKPTLAVESPTVTREEYDELFACLVRLTDRIEKLEVKRSPGRPAKHVSDDAKDSEAA